MNNNLPLVSALTRRVSNLCGYDQYEMASFFIVDSNLGVQFVESLYPNHLTKSAMEELRSIVSALLEE